MQQTIETIKQGEFVKRSESAAKTYIRGTYDASTKRYSLIDFDDSSREIFVKKGTALFIGFTF
jgi:hypothetical protein